MPVDETPDPPRLDEVWASIRTPVMAAVVVLISVIPPLERLRTSGWISDDTAWQVALRTWRPGGGELVLTENTYLLHWPLFVIGNVLLPSNRWTILVIAITLQAVGLWLIVSFARHAIAEVLGRPVATLRRRHDLLALGACGAYQVADVIMRQANAGVSTRNLEAGLYLVVIRLGYEVVVGERSIGTAPRWAAAAAATAVLSLNDPLIVYTIVVPFIAATVLAWFVATGVGRSRASSRWRTASMLASSAGAGLLIWRVVHALLPFLDVSQRAASTQIADVTQVPGQLRVVFGGLGQMAGRSLVSDPSVGVRLVGAVLLVTALVSVVAVLVAPLRRQVGTAAHPPWLAIIALGWLAIVATIYVITTSGASLAEFRYVTVAFPAVGVAVAVTLVMLPRPAQNGFTALAVVAIGFTGTLGMTRDHDDGELLMPDTAYVIDQLAAGGYDRGYSGYWTSSILTYFADAPVLPVVCSDAGRTVPYDWLVDMGRFDRVLANPGDRSFIVVDRRAALSLTCPDDLLIAQHGPPTDVIGVRGQIEVWLYDGDDVVADMTRAWAR